MHANLLLEHVYTCAHQVQDYCLLSKIRRRSSSTSSQCKHPVRNPTAMVEWWLATVNVSSKSTWDWIKSCGHHCHCFLLLWILQMWLLQWLLPCHPCPCPQTSLLHHLHLQLPSPTQRVTSIPCGCSYQPCPITHRPPCPCQPLQCQQWLKWWLLLHQPHQNGFILHCHSMRKIDVLVSWY